MTSPSTMTTPGSIVSLRVGRVLLIVCWLAVVYGTGAVVPHPASFRGIAAWISTLVFLLTFTLAVERPTAGPLILVSGLAGVAMQFIIAEGLNSQENAERLVVTEATVKTHINNIASKADLRDRAQAVIYAMRHGLAER